MKKGRSSGTEKRQGERNANRLNQKQVRAMWRKREMEEEKEREREKAGGRERATGFT